MDSALIVFGILVLIAPTILMIAALVVLVKTRQAVDDQVKNVNRLWWELNKIRKELIAPEIKKSNIAAEAPKAPAKIDKPQKIENILEQQIELRQDKPEPAPAPKPKPAAPVPPPPPRPQKIEIATKKPEKKPAPIPIEKPQSVKPEKFVQTPIKEPKSVKSDKPDFEEKVSDIFDKAAQWFIVGEDFRSKDVSKEYAVATTWLIRSSVFIILLGMAFFLKYSIEKDLIPPYLRVAMTAATGIGMLIASQLMAGKKYHKIGMGFMGGGIAILYFSIFAAYAIYKLISVGPAYAFMILITLTAGVLAVRRNSLVAAIFGIVGGYATPLLLRTSTPNLPGFFSYILMLGLGSLFIARYKQWRSLNILSFIFTYVLFLLAFEKVYQPSDFNITIAFLSGYFVLFSGLSIFYNIIHKEKITILEMLVMLANISLYMSLGLAMIDKKFGNMDYGAILTCGVAVFYIAQILSFLKMKIKDRNLLLILFTFAAFAITITFPILLSGQYLLSAWAIQAFLFLWLSCKINSNFLRILSYILYIICFWHLGAVDMRKYFFTVTPDYVDGLLDRFMSMGMFTLSLICSYLTLKKCSKASEEIITRDNDIEQKQQTNPSKFFWVGSVFVFIFLHFEAFYFAKAFYESLYLPLMSYIWITALVLAAIKLNKTKDNVYNGLISLLIVGLILKLLFVDLSFWKISNKFIYGGEFEFMPIIIRAVEVLPILMVFVFCFRLFSPTVEKVKTLKKTFAALAISVLFVYLTLELNYVLNYYYPEFRKGGVSILWGVFALVMIFRGIHKKIKPLRMAALTLFAITALKIFIVDLSNQSALVRTSVFIALGLAMLSGAFLYIRFKDSFEGNGDTQK